MHPKQAAFALAIAAALAATPALAADKRSSVSIFGNVTIPEEGDNIGSLFVSYGYLMTDSLELEGGVSQTFSRGFTSTNVDFGVKYYFGSVGAARGAVPYVKGNIGRGTSSGGGSGSNTFGGGAGLEIPIGENTATFVEGVYQQVKFSGFSTSQFSMQVGLKLRF